MTKQWTDSEKELFSELYLANVPVDEIGERFGISRQSVYRKCGELGLRRVFEVCEGKDVLRRRKELSSADWPIDWPRADSMVVETFAALVRAAHAERIFASKQE